MNDIEEVILHQTRRFIEFYSAGDAEAIATLYTDDAVLLAPGLSQRTGREAIQRFWQAAMDANISNFENLEFKLLKTADTLCIQYFTFEMTIPGKNGESRTESIKNVLSWELVDSEWLINLDVWNSPI